MNTKRKYNEFLTLYNADCDKQFIIKTLGISESTYKRYVKNFTNSNNSFIENYILANLLLCLNKEEMADYFKTSRKTLYTKEKELLKTLIPFLQLNGCSDDFISNFFRLQENTIKRNSINFSFDSLRNDIKLLECIKELTNDGQELNEIMFAIEDIKDGLKTLEHLTKKLYNQKVEKYLVKGSI